jgi:hypothetical protein
MRKFRGRKMNSDKVHDWSIILRNLHSYWRISIRNKLLNYTFLGIGGRITIYSCRYGNVRGLGDKNKCNRPFRFMQVFRRFYFLFRGSICTPQFLPLCASMVKWALQPLSMQEFFYHKGSRR